MFYILGILFILVGFEYIFRKVLPLKKFFLVLAGLFLIIVQGYNEWTPDLINYKTHFYNIDNEYIYSRLEPIYIAIIKIIKYFDGTFDDLILVYAILTIVLYLFFIYKSSPLPLLVFTYAFIVFYFTNLVQIRFFLAMSIFLYASLVYKQSKKKFWVLYVLAIISHYSLLAILPFFILRRLSFYENITKNNIIIIVGMVLLTLIPKSIAEPILIIINGKFSGYLEKEYTYLGTVALFFPFFILNNIVLWHYGKNPSIGTKYTENIPFFIELIQYANYIILLQYFIRDFSRITNNLSILSFIYISIVLFYNKKTKNHQVNNFVCKIIIYVWCLATFYLLYIALNDGEYFEIIEKTFLSNRIYG